MAEHFELYRLSLLPRPNRDLLEGPDPTREQYLRRVLGEELQFERQGIKFHYVPEINTSDQVIIVGRIGRTVSVDENRPPSEGLREDVHETWKAALIVIDPQPHADGQKAAVEFDRQVASTATLIMGLTQAINEAHPRAAYAIEPANIISVSSFWEFAEQNKGDVTMVSFDFVVPNMFGGSDSLIEELRDFREKEKAHRVRLALRSNDGLDLDTPRTREAVDYVSKTGGAIKAKARKGRRYSSSDKIETTTLSDPDQLESPLSRAGQLIARILGRE